MNDFNDFLKQLAAIRNGNAEKTTKAKEKRPIRKISKKREAEMAAAKKDRDNNIETDLEKYFQYHMKYSSPKCDNCGMVAEWLLEPKHEQTWRACQAHVLAKKDGIGGFPSVSTNIINHLVLFPHFKGLCNCHGKFDQSYESMAKMAVFPKAIDIINQLYPLIKPEERKYLPEVITQEIKPTIFNK